MDINFKKFERVRLDDDSLIVQHSLDKERELNLLRLLDEPSSSSKGRAKVRLLCNLHHTSTLRDDAMNALREAQRQVMMLSSHCISGSKERLLTAQASVSAISPIVAPATRLEKVRESVANHSSFVEEKRKQLQEAATLVRTRIEQFQSLDEEVKRLRRLFMESSDAFHIEVAAKCDVEDMQLSKRAATNSNASGRSSPIPPGRVGHNDVIAGSLSGSGVSVSAGRCVSPISAFDNSDKLDSSQAVSNAAPIRPSYIVDGNSVIPVIDDTCVGFDADVALRNMHTSLAMKAGSRGLRFLHHNGASSPTSSSRALSSSAMAGNPTIGAVGGGGSRLFPMGLTPAGHASIIIRKYLTVNELTSKQSELTELIQTATGGGDGAAPLAADMFSNLVAWKERLERVRSQLGEAESSLRSMLASQEGRFVTQSVTLIQACIRRANALRELRGIARFKSAVGARRLQEAMQCWTIALRAERHNRTRKLRKVFNLLVTNADEKVHRRTRFIYSVLRARGISTQRRIFHVWFRYTKYLSAPVHPVSMMREITFSDDDFPTAQIPVQFPGLAETFVLKPFKLDAWKRFVDAEQRRVRLLRSGVFFGTDPLLNQAYFLHRWRKYVSRKRQKRYMLSLAAIHESNQVQSKHFYAWLNLTTFSAQRKATDRARKSMYFTVWKRFIYREKREEEQLQAFLTVKKLTTLHKWRRRTVDARRTSVASHVRMVLNRGNMWYPVLCMLTAADPLTMLDVTKSSGGYAYRMVEGGTATQPVERAHTAMATTTASNTYLGSAALHNAAKPTASSASATRKLVASILSTSGADLTQALSDASILEKHMAATSGTSTVQGTLMSVPDPILSDPLVVAALRKKYWEYVTERVFVNCWKTWKGYTQRRLVYRQFLVARWQRRVRRLKGGCFSSWRYFVAISKTEKAGRDPYEAVPNSVDAKRMESAMYVESAGELLEDLSIISYKLKRTTLIRRYLVVRKQLDAAGSLSLNDEDLEEVVGVGARGGSGAATTPGRRAMGVGAPPVSAGRLVPPGSMQTLRRGSNSNNNGSSSTLRDAHNVATQLAFNPLGLYSKEITLMPLSEINRERAYSRAAFAHWMKTADRCLRSPLLRNYLPDIETSAVLECGHRGALVSWGRSGSSYQGVGSSTQASRFGSSFFGGTSTTPFGNNGSLDTGAGRHFSATGASGRPSVGRQSPLDGNTQPASFFAGERGVSFVIGSKAGVDLSRAESRAKSTQRIGLEDLGPCKQIFGGDLYMLRSFVQMLFLRRKRDKNLAESRRQAAGGGETTSGGPSRQDDRSSISPTLNSNSKNVNGDPHSTVAAPTNLPQRHRSSSAADGPRQPSFSASLTESSASPSAAVTPQNHQRGTTKTITAQQNLRRESENMPARSNSVASTTNSQAASTVTSRANLPPSGGIESLTTVTPNLTQKQLNGLSDVARSKAQADMMIVLCTGYPLHVPSSNEVSIRFMSKLIADECDRNFILQTRRKRRNDRILRKFEVRLRAIKFAESASSSFMASPLSFRIAGTSPFELLMAEYRYRAEQSNKGAKKKEKKGTATPSPSPKSPDVKSRNKKYLFPLPPVDRKRHLPFLLRLHLDGIVDSAPQSRTNIQNRTVIHFKAHLSVLWLQLARLKTPTLAPGSSLAADLFGVDSPTRSSGSKISLGGTSNRLSGGGTTGSRSTATATGLSPFQQQVLNLEGEAQREAIVTVLRTFEDRSLSLHYLGLKIKEAVRSQLMAIQARMRMARDNTAANMVEMMSEHSAASMDELDMTRRPGSADSKASSATVAGRRHSSIGSGIVVPIPAMPVASRRKSSSRPKSLRGGVFFGTYPPHAYDVLDLVGFNPRFLRRGLAQERTQRLENVKAILATQRALRSVFRDYEDLKASSEVSFNFSAIAPSAVGCGWNSPQKPSRSTVLSEALKEDRELKTRALEAKIAAGYATKEGTLTMARLRQHSASTQPQRLDSRARRWSFMSLEEALGYQERLERRSRVVEAYPPTEGAPLSQHVSKRRLNATNDAFYQSSGLLWPESDVLGYHDVPRCLRPWVLQRLNGRAVPPPPTDPNKISAAGSPLDSPPKSRPQSSGSVASLEPAFRYGRKRPSLHTESVVGRNYGNKSKLQGLQLKLLKSENLRRKAPSVGMATRRSLSSNRGKVVPPLESLTSMSVGRSHRIMSAPAVMRTGARGRRRHTDGADDVINEALREAAITNADALAANDALIYGRGPTPVPNEEDVLRQTLHLGELHDDKDTNSKRGNWKGESLLRKRSAAGGAELKMDFVFGEVATSDESEGDESEDKTAKRRLLLEGVTSPSESPSLSPASRAQSPPKLPTVTSLDATQTPSTATTPQQKDTATKQAKIQSYMAEMKAAAENKRNPKDHTDYEELEREASKVNPEEQRLRGQAQALADLLERESRASTVEERQQLHTLHKTLQQMNATDSAESVKTILDLSVAGIPRRSFDHAEQSESTPTSRRPQSSVIRPSSRDSTLRKLSSHSSVQGDAQVEGNTPTRLKSPTTDTKPTSPSSLPIRASSANKPTPPRAPSAGKNNLVLGNRPSSNTIVKSPRRRHSSARSLNPSEKASATPQQGREGEADDDEEDFWEEVEADDDFDASFDPQSSSQLRPSTAGSSSSPSGAAARSRPPTGSIASLRPDSSTSQPVNVATQKKRNSSAASNRSHSRTVRFEGGSSAGKSDGDERRQQEIEERSLTGSTSRPSSGSPKIGSSSSRPVSAQRPGDDTGLDGKSESTDEEDAEVALDIHDEVDRLLLDDDEEMMAAPNLQAKRSSLQGSLSSLPSRRGAGSRASVVHPEGLRGSNVKMSRRASSHASTQGGRRTIHTTAEASSQRKISHFGAVRVDTPETVDVMEMVGGPPLPNLYQLLAQEVQLPHPIPRLWRDGDGAAMRPPFSTLKSSEHQFGDSNRHRQISVPPKGAMELLLELSARHGVVLDAKKRLHMEALRKDLLSLVGSARHTEKRQTVEEVEDAQAGRGPDVSCILRNQFDPPSYMVDVIRPRSPTSTLPTNSEARLSPHRMSITDLDVARRHERLKHNRALATQLSSASRKNQHAPSPLTGGGAWSNAGNTNRAIFEATHTSAERQKQLDIAFAILEMLPSYLHEELDALCASKLRGTRSRDLHSPSQQRKGKVPPLSTSSTRGFASLTDDEVATALTATVQDVPAALANDVRRGHIRSMTPGPTTRKTREFLVKTCSVKTTNETEGNSDAGLRAGHGPVLSRSEYERELHTTDRGSALNHESSPTKEGAYPAPIVHSTTTTDFRSESEKEEQARTENNITSTKALLDGVLGDLVGDGGGPSLSIPSDLSQSLDGFVNHHASSKGGSEGDELVKQLTLPNSPDKTQFERYKRLLVPPSVHAFRALTSGTGSQNEMAQASIVAESLSVPPSFFRRNSPAHPTERRSTATGLTQRLREQVQATAIKGHSQLNEDNYLTQTSSPKHPKSTLHVQAISDLEVTFNRWLDDTKKKLTRQPTFEEGHDDVVIQIRLMRRRREALQAHRDDPFACRMSALIGIQINAAVALLNMPDPGPEPLFDAVSSKLRNSTTGHRPNTSQSRYLHCASPAPDASMSRRSNSAMSGPVLTDVQTGKLVSYIRNVKMASKSV